MGNKNNKYNGNVLFGVMEAGCLNVASLSYTRKVDDDYSKRDLNIS